MPHTLPRTRRVLLCLTLTAIGAGYASTASAIGGGPWYSATSPLSITHDGSTAGQTYGHFDGYSEHVTHGSVLSNVSYHRASGTSSNFRNGAYVSHKWWSNGISCYITSYSAPGISCGSGWFFSNEQQTPRSQSTTTWNGQISFWGIDPTGSSGRVGARVCIDITFASDPCSGTVYRGSDY